MLELTEQQMQAVVADGEVPLTVVNPRTGVPYVLLRKDVYDYLRAAEYDDGPWTEQEMDLLATEAGELLDNYRSKP